MRILAVDYPKTEKDERKLIFFKEQYEERIKPGIEAEQSLLKLDPPELDSQKRKRAGCCSEFRILMWRNKRGVQRDPMQSRAKIGNTVFFGIIIALIFNNVGFHNDGSIGDRVDTSAPIYVQTQQYFYMAIQQLGAFFFISINMFMANFFNSILVLQAERPVFLRENANKMYSEVAYFFAKQVTELPILCITPILATVIIYFSLDLAMDVEQFFRFMLLIWLVGLTASSYGFAISAMFTDPQIAANISPFFAMPLVLFGGFLANNNNTPAWLNWIQFVSPIRYCAEGLMWNEFSDDKYGLAKNVMDFVDYKLSYWDCVYVFVLLIVVCRFLAFIAFKSMVSRFQ